MNENLEIEVRKRLLKIAKETKRPSQEVLQYYAMERYLYRLSKSEYARKFILKGGLLINVWNREEFRATQDIDFLGLTSNHQEHISLVCKKICGMSFEDGVVFDPKTVLTSDIRHQNEYQGVMVKFKGKIDRSKIHMRIDIGFDDVVYPKPELFSFPTILEMPAPSLLGYTKESVIAEKIDAMLQLGELNSRMKDFYDVWFLSQRNDFLLDDIALAIERTLQHRKTRLESNPVIFMSEFQNNNLKSEQWENFCRQNGFAVFLGFDELIEYLKNFVSPILQYIREKDTRKGKWNPKLAYWELMN